VYYIIDTNIWIDVGQGKLACTDLLGKPGKEVVLAPTMLIELVRGIVKGGESHFPKKQIDDCMHGQIQDPGTAKTVYIWDSVEGHWGNL
jgi:predicted nucleic acid-binding protein